MAFSLIEPVDNEYNPAIPNDYEAFCRERDERRLAEELRRDDEERQYKMQSGENSFVLQ